ncbi:MAG: class I SAM-dependent methyltransferase [Alkalispirochaeta sp.]
MHAAYLEAKRTIDDRSINHAVWNHVLQAVSQGEGDVLRIAEIGAGTGTMIDRFREWGGFDPAVVGDRRVEYDAWEINPETAHLLRRRVEASADIHKGTVHVGDVRERDDGQRFDLVIANAVLDLFSPDAVAELVDALLAPDGLLYASIVFDGVTLMEPAIEPAVDAEVLQLYHRSMTQGFARRHVWALYDAGFQMCEVGSSDWIIPPRRGGPSEDERILVETILEMMERSVTEQITGEDDSSITVNELTRWIGLRREQLHRGALLFEAHQIDFVVQR